LICQKSIDDKNYFNKVIIKRPPVLPAYIVDQYKIALHPVYHLCPCLYRRTVRHPRTRFYTEERHALM